MKYSFKQVIKDKNLIKTLAEAAKRQGGVKSNFFHRRINSGLFS